AAGRQVLILEARDRIGGRIHTVINKNFTTPVETGAEFVHGRLPITLSFLNKAALHYPAIKGRSWTIKEGKLLQEEDFGTDWERLMKELNDLKTDMTIS